MKTHITLRYYKGANIVNLVQFVPYRYLAFLNSIPWLRECLYGRRASPVTAG